MDVIFEKNAIRNTFCGIYLLDTEIDTSEMDRHDNFLVAKKNRRYHKRKAPLLMLSSNFEIQRLAPENVICLHLNFECVNIKH